eukprot:388560_1
MLVRTFSCNMPNTITTEASDSATGLIIKISFLPSAFSQLVCSNRSLNTQNMIPFMRRKLYVENLRGVTHSNFFFFFFFLVSVSGTDCMRINRLDYDAVGLVLWILKFLNVNLMS